MYAHLFYACLLVAYTAATEKDVSGSISMPIQLDVTNKIEEPIGHLKPIGYQSPIVRGEVTEINRMISGAAFYRDFFIPAKPVVFRGVLKNSAAMVNWANETYMHENYGSVRGAVDLRKTWDRGGVEIPPRSTMNYSEFLNRFVDEEMYWDEAIPDDHKILKDMPLSLALNCEETRATFMYINLMVNSGNVSYVLHNDFADNFFHFLSGEKTWLLANSSFSDAAYIGEKTQSQSLSPVRPDSVDLIKYPRMSEIIYHEVILRAGDILYIPRNWLHYVRSFGSPNIGMNVWFGGEASINFLPKEMKCKRQIRSAEDIFKR